MTAKTRDEGLAARRIALLQRLGWTLHDLAACSGVSRGCIQDWVLDKHQPRFVTIRKIAKALGVSLGVAFDPAAETAALDKR